MYSEIKRCLGTDFILDTFRSICCAVCTSCSIVSKDRPTDISQYHFVGFPGYGAQAAGVVLTPTDSLGKRVLVGDHSALKRITVKLTSYGLSIIPPFKKTYNNLYVRGRINTRPGLSCISQLLNHHRDSVLKWCRTYGKFSFNVG